MKSQTSMILVLGLVGIVAFGLTYMNRRSAPETSGLLTNNDPKNSSKSTLREPAIQFFALTAGYPEGSYTPPQYLKLWPYQEEMGKPGFFCFFFQNKNNQPSTIRADSANCQCASVDVATFSKEKWNRYLTNLALAGTDPLNQAILSATAVAELGDKLEWKKLLDKSGSRGNVTIPGASEGFAQIGVLRLNWGGAEKLEHRGISTRVVTANGNQPPVEESLGVRLWIVNSFKTAYFDGTNFNAGPQINFGELRQNSQATRDLYVYSTTREALVFSLKLPEGKTEPCLQIDEPQQLQGEEFSRFAAWANSVENSVVRCAYRVRLRLSERVQTETGLQQLDLGPIGKQLSVESSTGGIVKCFLVGRVFTDDLSFPGGSGTLDFSTVQSDQGATKVLPLQANRKGLELKVAKDQLVPNYLEATLDSSGELLGKKNWRLIVTIPKNKLFGPLPNASAVVLETNDTPPRKIVIPVRGTGSSAASPF